MSLTDAEKQAYARASHSIISVWALEFRHSEFPATLRLVNYDGDIDHTLESTAPEDPSTLVTFSGIAFKFEAPEISDNPVTSVKASIDGVSGTLQPYLATASQSREAVEATLRELLYDTESETVLQQPSTFHMRVINSSSTMTSVQVEMTKINSANQVFPNIFYTAESNPGLE